MQSCRFLHDPQRSHWCNVLVRLVSKKPELIEFFELKKWKPDIPRLVHVANEGGPDRRLQFCEWFLHKCDEREYFKTQLFDQMKRHLNLMAQLSGIIVAYFQQDGIPPHFHVNVRNFLDHTFNQRWIGWRGSAMEFPPRSPDLTPLDYFLPLWNSKEHGVRHKTTNTGGTERPDWTWHQWYSISNIPDGLSLCSTSLLGVYCGRRVHILNMYGLKVV